MGSAALSDFGYDRIARQERLLSNLICRLLGKQPGEDHHDFALDECLARIKSHSFPDTDPNVTERLYKSLNDRLTSHAQYRKAEALSDLAQAVIDLDLQSETRDLPHKILSFLYHSSDSPLNACFHSNAHAQDVLGKLSGITVDDNAIFEEEPFKFSADECKAVSSYSSSSELSQWSDSDMEDDSLAEPRPSPASVSTGSERLTADVETWSKPFPPTFATEILPSFEAEKPHYCQARCLHHQILQTCGKCQAAENAECTTESSLCHQVISMLRGSRSPGAAFEWDLNSRSFSVPNSLFLPDLSPGLLRDLLQHFAQLGTIACRLWDAVIGTDATSPNPAKGLPSWAAFLTSIRRQLLGLAVQLQKIEDGQREQKQPASLMHLRLALQEIGEQLLLLKLAFRVAEESRSFDTAHERCAGLLTALHSLLCKASQLDGAQGQRQAVSILKLFIGTLKPMLGDLSAWLKDSSLPDTHDDFFIEQNMDVDIDSDEFWDQSYKLKKGAEGRSVCPHFLRPILPAILHSGKSLILLKRQQNQSPREPSGIVSGANCEDDMSLFEQCLESLQSLLKEGPSMRCTAAEFPSKKDTSIADILQEPSKASIAERMAQINCQDLAEAFHAQEISELNLEQSDNSSLQPPEALSPSLDLTSVAAPTVMRRVPMSMAIELAGDRCQGDEDCNNNACVPSDTGSASAWKDDTYMQKWLQRTAKAFADQEKDSTEMASDNEGMDGTLLTALIPASGSVLEQLWGTDSSCGNLYTWIEGMKDCQLPPIESLLETCLLQPIQSRVPVLPNKRLNREPSIAIIRSPQEHSTRLGMQHPCMVQHTGTALFKELMDRWKLRKQLQGFQKLYLGSSSTLLAFSHFVVDQMLEGRSLVDIPEADLQDSLEICLSCSAESKTLPLLSCFAVTVDVETHRKIMASLKASLEKRKAKDGASGGQSSLCTNQEDTLHTLVELKALAVKGKLPWPLTLVIDQSSIESYNAVFVFLIQLKWAKEAVSRALRMGARGQAAGPTQGLGMKLLHLINSLEHYVMYVLATACKEMEEALDAAQCLQAVQEAHREFLAAAAQPCMASTENSWHVIYTVLRKLLDMTLQLKSISEDLQDLQQTEVAGQKLDTLQSEFADRHRYLLKVLSVRSLKIGDKSGIQELVTMLNFNHYYA